MECVDRNGMGGEGRGGRWIRIAYIQSNIAEEISNLIRSIPLTRRSPSSIPS